MLIDVKDCPWVDKELIKSLIPIFGNYFPDLLYKQYIVRAGFVIRGLWNVVQGFLHPVTQAKINLMGSNTEEIKKELLKEMKIDEIPKDYGGTLNISLD